MQNISNLTKSEPLKLGQTISQISSVQVVGALEFGQIIFETWSNITDASCGALEQQFGPRGIMTEQVAGAKFCLTKQEITINSGKFEAKQDLLYHLNSA